MGKKDKKNKNKISGSVKTALKTEKKLNARQKKELTTLGEEDIEKVIAEIEKEEAHRQRIKEIVVNAPSRRVNFTLTAHPFKNELIMFGGEFYDGRQTIVYGDMFFYNINKQEWTLMKAPGAPPPRCGHQTVATTANGSGELWVFGGEFTSPSESQFYHYRDLWVFRFVEKKWEKITAANGPSARSGHRMVYLKKQLIVFGGFYDNLRHDYKYFNDVHIFDLESYMWRKIEPTGIAPAPRSGCILLSTADSKLVVYGGYSKEKIKKEIDRGCIHADMFLLTSTDKNDLTKYKWVCVKQTGIQVTPRCGVSVALLQYANQAFIFGGVFDDDDSDNDEESLCGIFYNDLFALDLEKLLWRAITLTERKVTTVNDKKQQKKKKKESDEESEQSNNSNQEKSEKSPNPVQPTVTVDDDGIFTMTIGSTMSISSSFPHQSSSTAANNGETKLFPSPRMNAGMVIKHNILYLYGGLVEEGDRQYTLCDFYSLDCRKLDEWKTLRLDDLSAQTWFDSSEENEDDSSEAQMEKRPKRVTSKPSRYITTSSDEAPKKRKKGSIITAEDIEKDAHEIRNALEEDYSSSDSSNNYPTHTPHTSTNNLSQRTHIHTDSQPHTNIQSHTNTQQLDANVSPYTSVQSYINVQPHASIQSHISTQLNTNISPHISVQPYLNVQPHPNIQSHTNTHLDTNVSPHTSIQPNISHTVPTVSRISSVTHALPIYSFINNNRN